VSKITLRAIKTRIYPNIEQQYKIVNTFGCCRFVWNQLLNMQTERYHNGGKFVSEFGMNYLIVQLKREYPFLKKVDSTSLFHVSRDLNSAFQKLFKEHSGYPKFKSRKFPKQSYQSSYINNNLGQFSEHRLKLPKLGTIYFRSGRQVEGKIKNATIRLSSTGKFYAIVLVDTEVNKLGSTGKSVGIDMGVADLMITSDGVKYPTIRFDKILARKKHYWEKRLARRRLQAMMKYSFFCLFVFCFFPQNICSSCMSIALYSQPLITHQVFKSQVTNSQNYKALSPLGCSLTFLELESCL